MYNYISYAGLSLNFYAFISNISIIQVPNTIQEALRVLEWKSAIWEEIRALEKNGTWELAELPRGKNPVGCKWFLQ